MAMDNAFVEPEEDMDMEEDKNEEGGITLVFSKKDGKKVMEMCDKHGISFDEDGE